MGPARVYLTAFRDRARAPESLSTFVRVTSPHIHPLRGAPPFVPNFPAEFLMYGSRARRVRESIVLFSLSRVCVCVCVCVWLRIERVARPRNSCLRVFIPDIWFSQYFLDYKRVLYVGYDSGLFSSNRSRALFVYEVYTRRELRARDMGFWFTIACFDIRNL